MGIALKPICFIQVELRNCRGALCTPFASSIILQRYEVGVVLRFVALGPLIEPFIRSPARKSSEIAPLLFIISYLSNLHSAETKACHDYIWLRDLQKITRNGRIRQFLLNVDSTLTSISM